MFSFSDVFLCAGMARGADRTFERQYYQFRYELFLHGRNLARPIREATRKRKKAGAEAPAHSFGLGLPYLTFQIEYCVAAVEGLTPAATHSAKTSLRCFPGFAWQMRLTTSIGFSQVERFG